MLHDAMSVFGPAFVAAVAAFIGAWLGLRRFRQEKVWEEKFAVYHTIFRALNDLSEEFEQLWDAHVSGRELPVDRERHLQTLSAQAWTEITKQSRIGGFLLSPKSEAALLRLVKEIERTTRSESYGEYLDNRGSAFGNALDALKKAARADLRAY